MADIKRSGEISRKTKETDIFVKVDIDGKGKADIDTGVGFFDHMLTALSVHSGISMTIKVKGDLQVDCHHTIEDTGIALGQALGQALGAKSGIFPWTSRLPWRASTSRTALSSCSTARSRIRAAAGMTSA